MLIIKPNTTLIRLKLRYPRLFYNQDWYHDQDFAHVPLAPAGYDWTYNEQYFHKWSAAEHAYIFATLRWVVYQWKYVWTSDVDERGDRIYVGMADRGGFQIHRHLTIREHDFANKMP